MAYRVLEGSKYIPHMYSYERYNDIIIIKWDNELVYLFKKQQDILKLAGTIGIIKATECVFCSGFLKSKCVL